MQYDIYQHYLEFYVNYYSHNRQKNNAINKINQLTDSKGSFHYLYKFYPDNHISFLIHTFGTLLKYVSDKNKTFAIILNLNPDPSNSYQF